MPIGSSTPIVSPARTPSAASARANSNVASANCSNVRRTPPKTSASLSGHNAAARSTWSARVQQALYGSGRLIGLREPDDVEAGAEAPQGSDQRRAEGQAEDDVAGRVGDVERQRGAGVGDQLRGGVVAAERDPGAEVHHRAEAEPGEPAGDRERDPAQLVAGDPAQAGAEQPDAAPGDHLPRRPRALAEEQVA